MTVPAAEYTTAIDRAKKSIAPQAELNEWLSLSSSSSQTTSSEVTSSSSSSSQSIHVSACSDDNGSSSTVTFEYDDDDDDDDDDDGGRSSIVFRDNVIRIPGCSFKNDIHGDSLPHVPAVLTGLLDDWPSFSKNPEGTTTSSWSVEDLAAREVTKTTTSTPTTPRVSLDGGPSFARQSMCQGKVTLVEYYQYCKSGEADNDVAPLYVFDPDILKSSTGLFESNEFSIPGCFSNDAMGCINGTEYRPLPPAWLLVGVKRSGTPIHDHPLTVGWNALLVGCKLWCCLPPDVDESLLLLNLPQDDDEDFDMTDFDLSALEWFKQCGGSDNKIPDCAKIIVQHPGEVVYLPAGWFHVVLNVAADSPSTAISVSLTLRRDLPVILPLLMEEDEDFAKFWINRLSAEQKEHIPSLLLEETESSSSSSLLSSER